MGYEKKNVYYGLQNKTIQVISRVPGGGDESLCLCSCCHTKEGVNKCKYILYILEKADKRGRTYEIPKHCKTAYCDLHNMLNDDGLCPAHAQ